jgi:hypothetical protein
MVFAVVRQLEAERAEVFRLDCRFEPRRSPSCQNGVMPDLGTFRPMADMQSSMSAARQMCEALVRRPSAWHRVLACFAADAVGNQRRAVAAFFLAGVGASGVIFCTAIVSMLAAFWPGDPFVLPLTGSGPRILFWMILAAGLLCLVSWTRLTRASAPAREGWKKFFDHFNASCVCFSFNPATNRRFAGPSAGLALTCALARILPDHQQPLELDWQIPLRDPAKHWVFAVAIDDPEQGTLKPVDGLAEKLMAILRHNSAEGNTRLTHAVFHIDNQTDVEKAWFKERGTELRTMPQPGGGRVAKADELTMIFCRKKGDLLNALQHPQRGRRLGIMAALVSVCALATVIFPTAAPPLLSATCATGPLTVTGSERLVVKVNVGDVALCTLTVTAVGFPGPFQIGYETQGPASQGPVVRVIADRELMSGEARRTRQREIAVYFSSRLAGARENHLANLTVSNRGGRSAHVSILFTVGSL